MIYVIVGIVAVIVIAIWLWLIWSQNPEDRWIGRNRGQGGGPPMV